MDSQKRKFTDIAAESIDQHSNSGTLAFSEIPHLNEKNENVAQILLSIEDENAAQILLSIYAVQVHHSGLTVDMTQHAPIADSFSQNPDFLSPQAAPVYFSSPHFERLGNKKVHFQQDTEPEKKRMIFEKTDQDNHPFTTVQKPTTPQDMTVLIQQVTTILSASELARAFALRFSMYQLIQIVSGTRITSKKDEFQNIAMLKRLLDPSSTLLMKLLQIESMSPAIISNILNSASGGPKIMLLILLLGKELSWETGPIHSFMTPASGQTNPAYFDAKKVLGIFARKADGVSKALVFGVCYKKELIDLGLSQTEIVGLISGVSTHLTLPLLIQDLHSQGIRKIRNLEKGEEYIQRILTSTLASTAQVVIDILEQCHCPKEQSLSIEIIKLEQNDIDTGASVKSRLTDLKNQKINALITEAEALLKDYSTQPEEERDTPQKRKRM